jgi:D-alanine-D-alanine ligase
MSGKKVLVLYGGTSNEREVSLRSGTNVAQQLQQAGYEVVLADSAGPGLDLAAACAGVSAVLPMLHGAGGEDGSIQRQLDALGVCYVGSSATACALTFDKAKTKELLAKNGLPTPQWEVVNNEQFEASSLRRRPFVLKTITGGSTIDTLIVRQPSLQTTDPVRIAELFKRYERMLLEELVEGSELTVGILGDEPLPVILIVPPSGGDFDYENKYNGASQEIVDPPQVASDIKRRAQELALKVHRLTGCRHLSRTDIMVTTSGELYVLELNTLPGMTAQSLFPKAAAAAGYDMPALGQCFVQLALSGAGRRPSSGAARGHA